MTPPNTNWFVSNCSARGVTGQTNWFVYDREMDRTEASRRRLLDASAREFAAHGIAGARVDRISREARVSKNQMYAYYESKEGLFEAVLADVVRGVVDQVILTAEDLRTMRSGCTTPTSSGPIWCACPCGPGWSAPPAVRSSRRIRRRQMR